MAIRKRSWPTRDGTTTVYIATVGSGKNRQSKQFEKKKDAERWVTDTKAEIEKGTNVRASKSPTVRAGGADWIKACVANHLEPVTIADYQSLLNLHIYPFLGDRKLSSLTIGVVRKWQDDLRTDEYNARSESMIKHVTTALGSLLADAQERGYVAQNVVRNLKANRKHGKDRKAERRAKKKLQIGVDIPTPKEVDAILAAAGDDRPLFLVLFRCGLRASELRGLIWTNIDLDLGLLHVRQRANRHREIGKVKSESGYRTIPLPLQHSWR